MQSSSNPALGKFLVIPFAANAPNRKVSEGWEYSDEERSIHPNIQRHFAVDFVQPWGTPVYAPADGQALASYHTFDMMDSKGRTIGFGLGLFVQLWHEQQQLFSSYSHLSGINDAQIDYIPPELVNGNWQPKKALYIPLSTFKSLAKPVRTGDLLGYVGYTGLRLAYEEIPANPPRIDPNRNTTWDPNGPHLHWEVYTRTPDGGAKDRRYDPFGMYGQWHQYSDAFNKASGLILANPNGSPQFAR